MKSGWRIDRAVDEELIIRIVRDGCVRAYEMRSYTAVFDMNQWFGGLIWRTDLEE